MFSLPSTTIKKLVIFSLIGFVIAACGFSFWFSYHITRVKEIVSEVYHPTKIYEVTSVEVKRSNITADLGRQGLFSGGEYNVDDASGSITFTYDLGGTSVDEHCSLSDYMHYHVPGPTSKARVLGYYEGTYRLYSGRIVTRTTKKALRVGDYAASNSVRYYWVSVEPYRDALSLPVTVRWSSSNGKVSIHHNREDEVVFDNRW